MKLFESQIETRTKYDIEETDRAYEELASSVTDPRHRIVFHIDDLALADGAIKTCLRYCGVKAGSVPDSVEDFDARLEYACLPTGTMRRTVKLSGEWYKRAIGAMLGRLDTGEPIALVPQAVRGYVYYDPGTKRKVRVNARTAAHIDEAAVLFYRPLPARPLGIRDLLSFIFRVFDRNDYFFVMLASALVTLVGFIPPQVSKLAFGTVVPSGQPRLILPLAGLLVGVAISSALISAVRNLVMARVSTKLDVVTTAATFSRLLTLPTSFFKQYASGDLGTRVADVTLLATTLASILLGSLLSSLFSLTYIFLIGSFAPSLALPALLVVLIQAGLTLLATLITVRYERQTMELSAKLSGIVTALLNGIQKLKLAGAEDRAFARWAHGYAEYAEMQYNRPAMLRALPAIVGFVGMLGTVAIYSLAGGTGVSVENYMGFSVAFGQVSAAIMELANTASEIARVNPLLDMVEPILKTVPEIDDGKPVVEGLTGGIEVSKLSFRYDDSSPYVLQNLSFKVNPGEYVAIVGRSGCGKSTLIRLLLGFETPERGTIMYGKYDVEKVDIKTLRQHIGVVMQDGKLFMGDLASNITISAPSATLDDAWDAAEIAGIADDIRKMPMGMQTIVTEGGGGVSGGQRQRLMIARAVCGHRRILMLDEATSALDNKTQKHVSDSLEKLKCTRIVVAHRLSTVRHCDRILVLDGGRIAEEGSYEELIAKGGIFSELVLRQRLDLDI